MNKKDNYPLFIPPEHLTSKCREKWNLKEAKEYLEWLLCEFENRIGKLLDFLGDESFDDASEHLMALGKKAVELLKKAPFSEESATGNRLTNTGYALAADMGLLVAKHLLLAHPEKIRWEIIRKPKSEISYNLPVLEGFSFNYLEPIGGSVAEAQAVLRDQRGADAWSRIYDFWVSKVS